MATRLSTMRLAATIILITLSTGLTTAACGGNDDITIEDKREMQGSSVVETLRADNSRSSTMMAQDLSAKKQFSRDIQITPSPGVKLNTTAVREKILDNYSMKDGTAEQVCVVPVEVPEGKTYEYDMEWREVWREGVIQVGTPDDTPEGTYRFLQSLTCQIVGQRALN